MSYKDKTFCAFYKDCADGLSCGRKLSDDIISGAKKAGLHISQFVDKPDCYKTSKELENLKEEYLKLMEKNNVTLENDVAKKVCEVGYLKELLEKSEAKIRDLEEDIDSLDEDEYGIIVDLEEEVSDLENELEDLNTSVALLEEKLDGTNAVVSDLEGEIDGLKEQIDENNDDIVTLEEEVEYYKNELEERTFILEEQLENRCCDIETLEEDIKTIEMALKEEIEKGKEKERKILKLENLVVELQETIDDYKPEEEI